MRRRYPRLALAFLLALSLGCGRGEWRKPLPLPPSPPPPRQVQTESRYCPGGLLCESKAPLRGWRVPVGCQLTAQGQYLEACFLAESSWPLVAEFFRSRYPATQVVVSGLQVRAPTAPPAWKLNPGVVLPEGAPVPKPPAPTGPSLSVRRKANGVELVAVGAVAPLTQR